MGLSAVPAIAHVVTVMNLTDVGIVVAAHHHLVALVADHVSHLLLKYILKVGKL